MFTLLPPSSCLAEQLSPHTRRGKPTLTFLFAPLRKPIKLTAEESPDYKADEPTPRHTHTHARTLPLFCSSPLVCVLMCGSVCTPPRAMLRADQVGM